MASSCGRARGSTCARLKWQSALRSLTASARPKSSSAASRLPTCERDQAEHVQGVEMSRSNISTSRQARSASSSRPALKVLDRRGEQIAAHRAGADALGRTGRPCPACRRRGGPCGSRRSEVYASAAASFAACSLSTSGASLTLAGGFSAMPSLRGMTWTWRWNTTWPPALSLNCCSVTPSAPNRLDADLGDPLRDLHHVGEVVGRDVEDVARRRFRDDQRVAGRARHDVEEGERLVVLVDLVARNLAAQDLGEDVALVVAWVVVGHFVLPVHQSSIAGG